MPGVAIALTALTVSCQLGMPGLGSNHRSEDMFVHALTRSLLGIAMPVTLCATAGMAQTPMPGDSIHAAKTLFTWRDAALAAAFAGLTVAMFPADRSIAQHLQDSST